MKISTLSLKLVHAIILCMVSFFLGISFCLIFISFPKEHQLREEVIKACSLPAGSIVNDECVPLPY